LVNGENRFTGELTSIDDRTKKLAEKITQVESQLGNGFGNYYDSINAGYQDDETSEQLGGLERKINKIEEYIFRIYGTMQENQKATSTNKAVVNELKEEIRRLQETEEDISTANGQN